MTRAEAESVLYQPLRFGDEKQISARRFLERLAEAEERLETCDECKGAGLAHGEECLDCEGEGYIEVECDKCGGTGDEEIPCHCIEEFPDDVQAEARE